MVEIRPDCVAVAHTDVQAESARPLDGHDTARPLERLSPQWTQVYAAMDALRYSLDQHNLMTTEPAIAHDFVTVLASLACVRGEALVEAYWRAQLQRMLALRPNLKEPQVRLARTPAAD